MEMIKLIVKLGENVTFSIFISSIDASEQSIQHTRIDFFVFDKFLKFI